MHCLNVPDPSAEGGRDVVGPTHFPVNVWYIGASADEARTPETRTMHDTRMRADANNELEPTLMDVLPSTAG